MAKDKRFLPVEYHEPVEEDTDFELDMDEDEANIPKKRNLYMAS